MTLLNYYYIPSGNLTYLLNWTWPFIVDLPIKHGDFPLSCGCLPEGSIAFPMDQSMVSRRVAASGILLPGKRPFGALGQAGGEPKSGTMVFLQPFCWDLSWDIYIIYIYNPQVRWKHVHIELIEAYELWMKLMNESYGRNWCPVSGWILPLSLARRWLLRALLETLELVLRQARSIFLDPAVDHHLAMF